MKCFVYPLLSPDHLNPEKLGDVIEGCNPHHLLYIINISFKDFIDMVRKVMNLEKY